MSNESKPNPYIQSVHKPRKIHLNGFGKEKLYIYIYERIKDQKENTEYTYKFVSWMPSL